MSTKADVVAVVARTSDLTKKNAAEIVDNVFEAIDTLCQTEGKVTVKGFGTFAMKTRAAKQGRNPQTGEPLTIASKTVMAFKQSNK